MTDLADLTVGALVRGILDRPVRIVQLEWHGSDALTLTYTDESRQAGAGAAVPGRRISSHRRAARAAPGRWMPTATYSGWCRRPSGSRLPTCSTRSWRCRSRTLDPLPHQIDAVYTKMLPRQPLRFLLADDPGAGKTIMAGLFCKELVLRGDVERCLVIAPGSLVEQWQDELWSEVRPHLRDPHPGHDRGVAYRQPVRGEASC